MGGGLKAAIFLATRNPDQKGKGEYMAMQIKVSHEEETAATKCFGDTEKKLDSFSARIDYFEEASDRKMKNLPLMS